MAHKLDPLKIVETDTMRGNVLVHFSNGISVHYLAQFLWDVREQDGNVAISDSETNDMPLTLPE